ncbi:MAG TPA: nuclear transport factor 2 family protein [Vicinamibacterales bacterium]|nr:nuclear transport factor 2 family protein [Vicinamibacterales bacterium]
MTTKETVQNYFSSLKQRNNWDTFMADDVVFTSFTSPIKRVSGKASFLESTKRFYSTIAGVDVKDLFVEGNKACARTTYSLQFPGGQAITSDVAEVFEVRNGKIQSFDIYFDSAPFPK